MNICLIEKPPFRYVLVDDFYTKQEVKLIKEELVAFAPYGIDGPATGAAKDAKTGSGVILDDMFKNNRSKSKILTANRKLFCDELLKKAVLLDASFWQLYNCNYDNTLVNYYTNQQEYKAHRDFTALTALTFFSIGSFTGGDFYFPEYDERVPFKENRLIIFSGAVLHQALPISATDDSCRVSIAQFLTFKKFGE
jgi:hypothetical protein